MSIVPLLLTTGALTPGTGGGVDIGLRFLPNAFSDGTFPLTITYDKNQAIGSRWSTNFAAAVFKDTGTTYYVNGATGNDTTGDGSSGTPWATIQKAIDTVAAGSIIEVAAGRYAEIAFDTVGMDMSLVAASGATVIVGDLVAEADISAWGTLDVDGYLTCTLTSGTIDNWCDLTATRRGFPPVARQVADKTAGDAAKTAGDPAFITGSQTMGAIDERDLDGEADTNLLIWTTTAANPIRLASSSQIYCEGIIFAGNAPQVAAGALLILNDSPILGSRGEVIDCTGGDIITVNSCARGASTAASNDVANYYDDATVIEINSVFDHPSTGANDQASTGHIASKIVSIGCTYDADGGQTIQDIGVSERLLVDSTFGTAGSYATGSLGMWMQGITQEDTGDTVGNTGFPVYLIDEVEADYPNITFTELTEIASPSYIHSETEYTATNDPGAVSNCLGFFDSNDNSSIQTSGSNVTAWNNLSGAADNIALETGTPTVTTDTASGRQVVHFAAGVYMLGGGISTAINTAQAFTYYMIAKPMDAANYRAFMHLGTFADGVALYLGGGQYVPAFFGGNAIRVASVSSSSATCSIPLGAWSFTCLRFDGSTLSLFRDRIQLDVTRTPTLNFADDWPINRRGTGHSASSGEAYHAEHGLYSAALSTATIRALQKRAIDLYGTRR